MCGQVEFLMQFDLTNNKDSLPSTCVLPHRPLRFTGTRCWPRLQNLPSNTLKFTAEKFSPSICICSCGSNTAVLHHSAAVKYFNCCPKIILDAGLVLHVKLQFPGLLAHLTSIHTICFCAGTVDTREELWRQIQQCVSEVNSHPKSSNSWEFEECRLLGCGAVYILCEPKFRRNVSPPSSG
jgi:hypothetical protein